MSEKKEASQKTLEQRLMEIGYNDSPLRRDVINTFKEWLQQRQKNMTIPEGYHQGILKIKKETIKELLEELNEK